MVLAISGCGGGESSKTEVVRLKSTPPNAFVKLTGPAGAVNYIADRLAAASFKKDEAGIFLPPADYPRPRCSFSHVIGSADTTSLRQWKGKKVTIAVYDSAGLFCQVLRRAIFRTTGGVS